jgi:hypothetical protein
VQAVISIEIALLHGTVSVEFNAGVAVELRRRRHRHEDACQSRRNDDAVGRIAAFQRTTLQGEPPPYPTSTARAGRLRAGRGVPDESQRLARIAGAVPAAPFARGRFPEVT